MSTPSPAAVIHPVASTARSVSIGKGLPFLRRNPQRFPCGGTHFIVPPYAGYAGYLLRLFLSGKLTSQGSGDGSGVRGGGGEVGTPGSRRGPPPLGGPGGSPSTVGSPGGKALVAPDGRALGPNNFLRIQPPASCNFFSPFFINPPPPTERIAPTIVRMLASGPPMNPKELPTGDPLPLFFC